MFHLVKGRPPQREHSDTHTTQTTPTRARARLDLNPPNQHVAVVETRGSPPRRSPSAVFPSADALDTVLPGVDVSLGQILGIPGNASWKDIFDYFTGPVPAHHDLSPCAPFVAAPVPQTEWTVGRALSSGGPRRRSPVLRTPSVLDSVDGHSARPPTSCLGALPHIRGGHVHRMWGRLAPVLPLLGVSPSASDIVCPFRDSTDGFAGLNVGAWKGGMRFPR